MAGVAAPGLAGGAVALGGEEPPGGQVAVGALGRGLVLCTARAPMAC